MLNIAFLWGTLPRGTFFKFRSLRHMMCSSWCYAWWRFLKNRRCDSHHALMYQSLALYIIAWDILHAHWMSRFLTFLFSFLSDLRASKLMVIHSPCAHIHHSGEKPSSLWSRSQTGNSGIHRTIPTIRLSCPTAFLPGKNCRASLGRSAHPSVTRHMSSVSWSSHGIRAEH